MAKTKVKPPKVEAIKPKPETKEEERKREREKLAVELRESGLTVDQKRARVREFLAGG